MNLRPKWIKIGSAEIDLREVVAFDYGYGEFGGDALIWLRGGGTVHVATGDMPKEPLSLLAEMAKPRPKGGK